MSPKRPERPTNVPSPEPGAAEPTLAGAVRWDDGYGYLEVKAAPNAPRTEFFGVMADGAAKIRIKARAEGGRANAALADFLKKDLDVVSVEIIAGAGNSRKVVRVRKA